MKMQRAEKQRSMFSETFYRICQNRLAVICMIIFAIIVILVCSAGIIAPGGYDEQHISNAFKKPSFEHIFGTDNFGRDIFVRVLYGGRITLLVSIASTFVATIIGLFFGCTAGYFGGWVDNIIMRVMDVFMAIPSMIMAIVIATTMGSGMVTTVLAVAIGAVPGFVRVVRAPILSIRTSEYVESARAIGAKPASIIIHHIIPNIMAQVIVQVTLGIANSIISVAGLSFLGLGVQPPTPEWGTMLSQARNYMMRSMYMVTCPGIAIVLSVISLNVIGDALRDALDPRLKN